jgi:uncharacterized protein YndB with AHSA1/START domain
MTAQSPTRERRSIQLHVEVPGTPEQVWQAIATGPGIGAWITAAEVVGREGGTISLDLGSGMEECAVVTTWEPPRRLVAQEEWPGSDGAPARLVSEWLVEPNSRSTCLVRLRTIVDSAAESRADWDRELASMREGWTMFLRNLWLYRAYFADQPCSRIVARTPTTGPLARAWRELAERLGIAHAVEGERVHVDAPPLVVELAAEPSIAAGAVGYDFAAAARRVWPGARVGHSFADANGQPVVLVLRDAARRPKQQACARELVARRPDTVVVETGLPGWRPSGARGYVVTNGAARVSLDAAVQAMARCEAP